MNNWFTRYLVGMWIWLMPICSYLAWGRFVEHKDYLFFAFSLIAGVGFWIAIDVHKAMAKRS